MWSSCWPIADMHAELTAQLDGFAARLEEHAVDATLEATKSDVEDWGWGGCTRRVRSRMIRATSTV